MPHPTTASTRTLRGKDPCEAALKPATTFDAERELRESRNMLARVNRLIDLGHWSTDLAAARLQALMRGVDLVARAGGDEFVVVLRNSGPNEAAIAAQRIVNAFRQPLRVTDHTLSVSASIGVACFPGDGVAIEWPRCALSACTSPSTTSGRGTTRSRSCGRAGSTR